MENNLQITLICNTKSFNGFTFGKMYKGYVNYGNIFNTLNDKGEISSPCITGIRWIFDRTEKVDYFISLDEWREIRIKKLLD